MVCLILCLLASVSAVAASDINSTGTTDSNAVTDCPDTVLKAADASVDTDVDGNSTLDDKKDDSNSKSVDNKLSASESNEKLGEPTTGTLTDLYNEIRNGAGPVIYLTKDIYEYTNSYSYGVSVNKNNVVIDGQGCTIDGKNSARIFQVSSSYNNVTFRNINFINTRYTSDGGAIYATGSIIVENCNFSSSYSTYNGGAIYATNNLTVENCTFNGTSASNGGAIYSTRPMTIINSIFESCKANTGSAGESNGGGAIFAGENTIIRGSKFKNTSAVAGGAILSHYNLTVDNCTFESCKSTADSNNVGGGAIQSRSFGSEINNRNWYIDITNSSFNDNSAIRSGGAVSIVNGKNQIRYVTVDNCRFESNTVSTTNAVFGGGALYMNSNCEMEVSSSYFFNNSAPYSEGGVIRFSSPLSFNNCEFYSNYANQGGVANAGQAVSFSATNCKFENNYAKDEGGALKIRNFVIDNCTFTNNTAPKGGAIVFRQGSGEISDSNFTKNNATSGGAVYGDYRADALTIKTSVFDENTAKSGGALYSDSTMATLNAVSFNNNVAERGGAVYVSSGKSSITNSNFFGNNATIEGGAIYVLAQNTELYSAFFSDNNALLGGAISFKGDNGKIQRSNFLSNNAGNGTAIYWMGNSGNIIESTFDESNTASGAVYWHGQNGQITGSNFIGNKGVYVDSNGVVNFDSNTQLSASNDGYAVYIEGKSSFVSNTFNNLIINNGTITSDVYAITLNNETVVISGSSMKVYTVIVDDNGNFIKLNETIYNVYDSNRLNTTFNGTHYVSDLNNISMGFHDVTSEGFIGTSLTNLNMKPGSILYLVLNLTVNQTNYGEKVVFTTVLVNTTQNGTIVLDINGVLYDVPLVNGTAVLTLYNMAPNTYDVVATYVEYNATVHAELEILVELRNSTINVTANNITYGDIVSINVTVTNSSTGTVYLFVNNKMYILKLVNSTAQLNLTNVPGGDYTVFAIYNGDAYFKESYNSTNFTVSKVKPTINIEVNNITVDQNATIRITMPDDIKGTYTVYVGDRVFTSNKTSLTLNVGGFSAGNETVRVVYIGDEKYTNATNSTVFEVSKKNMTIIVQASDIRVGDNETVTVIIPYNARSLILLKVNSTTYFGYATDGIAKFVISGLKEGVYNVSARYIEGPVYYNATNSTTFVVSKVAAYSFNVTAAGDSDLNAIINITLPSDIDGIVTVNFNGTNYTVNMVKGKGSLVVPGLTGGLYNGTAYLENDTKYMDGNRTFTVNLNTIVPTITLNYTHTIYVDDDAIIRVNINNDATGNITLKVNNTDYTAEIIDGVATFNITGLEWGTYRLNATFIGDRKYAPGYNDLNYLTVKRIISYYGALVAPDIFVGQNATITVYFEDDAGGYVNITINGSTYRIDVVNGTGSINVSGLKFGQHPILADYSGDRKYEPSSREYEDFYVRKYNNYPFVPSGIANDTCANITVTLPDDSTGHVNITVNNITYTNIPVIGGRANLTVGNLTAGTQYPVEIDYSGDEKYLPGSRNMTLNSNKTADYVFNVTSENIHVGETAYIHIYLPNATDGDEVLIQLEGRDPIVAFVNNGTIVRPIADLKEGTYFTTVTYRGNDRYEASIRTLNIRVSKVSTFIFNITAHDAFVGENETIVIRLPTDTSGNVTVIVSINDTNYTVKVVNGTAVVTVPNLPEGNYSAFVYFTGDDKYHDANKTAHFKVYKVENYDINATTQDIFVNQNETIKITVPVDVSGTVTITISNTTYVNKTVEIVNGTGWFNVTGLKEGTYDVIVTLSNDLKYEDKTVYRKFKVSPIVDYDFILNYTATVYVKDNITITVQLPANATGNITVNMFYNKYYAPVVNGTATINITAPYRGTFPFIVSFEEEGKYTYKEKEGTVTIYKKDVELNPQYKHDVEIDENVTVSIQLPKDATGTITLISRGSSYVGTLVNGSVNMTLPGFALASLYSPSLVYSGDDVYNANSTTLKINVTKKDYEMNVDVANITVFETEKVNITLPEDATDDVLIYGNFSTGRYSVLIKNGTANFDISGLAAGTYSITVEYQGFDKYVAKNVTKTFTVSKVLPNIAIELINSDTIRVTLSKGATGSVLIKIANKTENVTVTDGVALLNVSDVNPGNYLVNVTYSGDDKYLKNNASRNVTIPKSANYSIIISAADIIVGENATIIVSLPNDATGKVNITINNGQVIEVPIVGGKAIFNATNLPVGKYSITANYSSDKYDFNTNSSTFNVNKIKTVLTPVVSVDGRNITVTVGITVNATGNITVLIDNNPYELPIVNNSVNMTLKVRPGDHVVQAKYIGDDNHTDATSSLILVSVEKEEDYTLPIELKEVITVVENNTIVVTLPSDSEGTFVKITVNSEVYYADVNQTTKKAVLDLSDLPAGKYNVTAEFSDDIYALKTNTSNFTVVKLNTTIDVQVANITKDMSEVINITLNVNATGYVFIDINDTVYFQEAVNGTVNLTVSNLDVGKYTVIVTYFGDDYFNGIETTTQFEVSKIPVDIIVSGDNIIVGHDLELTIKLSKNITDRIVVTVGDKNYTTFVYRGMGNLTVKNLEIGTYNVTAYFDGADDYVPVKNSTLINVTGKIKTTTTIKVDNITLGENATVYVTVANATHGNVAISIAGTVYTTQLVNGTANFTVSGLPARDYQITAFFMENDDFLGSNASTEFTVYKLTLELTINATSVFVGEDVVITVNITNGTTGVVLFEINGTDYYINLTAGQYSLVIPSLAVGNYTVNAIYNGDSNYKVAQNTTTFNVTKRETGIVINSTDIVTGQTEVFVFETTANFTEVVIIEVGGRNYTTFVQNGKGSFAVDGLTGGNYTATIYFPGNSQYAPVSNITSFKVSGKNASAVTIKVSDITLGEDAIVYVNVTPGATGDVSISVYGATYTKTLVDGKVNFTVSGLPARDYPITAYYLGDDNYLPSNASTSFVVNKKDAELIVNATSVFVGEDVVIAVNITNGTTGVVLFEIEGTDYFINLTAGQYSLVVPGLAVGNYTVNAIYNGDSNYKVAQNSTTFNVTKRETGIVINSTNIIVGSDEIFTFETTANFTEVVIIEVGGRNYTTFVQNGKGSFAVSGLAVGDYTATIYFPGNSQYAPVSNITSFKVTGKKLVNITVSVADITVGENATVYVALNESVNDMVYVTIAGIAYDVMLVDGKVNFTVSGLIARDYHVSAFFMGNSEYAPCNTTSEFKVLKRDTELTINATSVFVGEDVVIAVNITNGTTGVVLFDINGTDYFINLTAGQYSLVIPSLAVGNYTVNAIYNGDSNYKVAQNSTTFNVTKRETGIVINSTDIVTGQTEVFVFETTANFTEVVIIEVGGRNYTTFVENGKGSFSVAGLTGGNYTATIYFLGNTQYAAVSNTTSFEVKGKKASAVTIKVDDITLGEDAIVYVNVTSGATGRVALSIYGTTIVKDLVNGSVNFTVAGLPARDFPVSAYYLGDDNFLTSNATTSFTVHKLTPELTVNATSVFVGDETVITVNVTAGATGVVLVDINGTDYFINLTAGDNILSVELPVGNYTVKVTYNGDANYTTAENSTTFTVSKRDTGIVINSTDIIVGQTEVFTFETSADITEVVIVEVGGRNYTTFVENGKGSFSVAGLTVGDYIATIYFPGNSQYGAVQNTTSFKVNSKKLTNMTISVADITVGENATVYVTLNESADGVAFVVIAGTSYEGRFVDGKVNFTVSGLTARDYHVSAFYMGNDEYELCNTTSDFKVLKKDAEITVNATDVFVGDETVITVNVTAGATGVVLVDINGTDYFINLTAGDNSLSVELPVGNYTVKVTYNGDANYTTAEDTTTFTVSKRDTGIVINSTDIIVGQTEVFTFETSADITEVVIVEVGGRNYTTFVENGKGNFSVAGLAVGDYIATIYFPGNTQYNAVSNTTSFRVTDRKLANITIEIDDITVGEDAVVYVTMNETINGMVYVTIAGVAYDVMLVDGKVNFTVSGLIARDYHASVFFMGNDEFAPVNATTDFKVNKKDAEITVNATDVCVGYKTVITVNVTTGATGVVLVDINGTDYFINLTAGDNSLSVELPVGNYTVKVTYNGDANYTTAENSTNFTVSKHIPEFDLVLINGEIYGYGENVILQVLGPQDVTGIATVTVGDGIGNNTYTVYINNGVGTLVIEKPSVGHYNASAKYEENYKYISINSPVRSFEVYMNGTEIDVNTHDIYIGENETIIVSYKGEYTGNVTIYVDGVEHNATGVYDPATDTSTATLVLSEIFTAGTHDVKATFTTVDGEGRTVVHEGTNTFEAFKNNSTTLINPISDIKVGENVTITFNVLPSDATGQLIIRINGKEYTVLSLDNLTLTVPNLGAGEYVVRAIYEGDDKYLGSENETSFTVSKNDINVILDVEDISIDEVEMINVTLPSDATGHVLINVNGNHYYAEIVNGTAQVNLTDLTEGKYEVIATFVEDSKYYGNFTNATFVVSKLETGIVINSTDIFVGQDEVFTFETGANFTEVVIIEVGGRNYTTFVQNGKGNFSVAGLAVGDYIATIYFPGNTQYNAVNNTTSFRVTDKKLANITIEIDDITVGEDAVVYVTMNETINGMVYVTIAGVAYDVMLVDGKVNFTVPDLIARDYHASVFFMGNDEFAPVNATTEFKVNKKDAEITVNATDVFVGDETVITVNVTAGATGVVLVDINGTDYFINLTAGADSLSVALPVGYYTVKVTYNGDENYGIAENSTTFTVSKRDTGIVISGSDIIVGQDEVFTFETTANITEVVIVEVGGRNYTTFVENGKGNFSVAGLAIGSYNATIYFPGNTQYNAITNTTSFRVSDKKLANITIEIDDITVGEDAVVYVTMNETINGMVYVTIAGVAYDVILEDGKVNFTVSGLIARDYHASVFFMGNDEFAPVNATTDFKVNKKDAEITVNATNVFVGDETVITVNVTAGATGVVLVDINGTDYFINLTAGDNSLNVALPVGDYTVKVTYNGDENYDIAENSTTFTVSKRDTGIVINSTDIVYGQDEVFTFETTANITEVVIIEVGGRNYTTFVKDGKGNFTVSGLATNTYTATIYFLGNTKYGAISNKTTFVVSAKLPSEITITVGNITVGENATIKVNVTPGTTGNVTIVIRGNEYTQILNNSEATFNISGLIARDYEVTAIYDGDVNYLNSTAKAAFTVNKIDPNMNATATTVVVGNDVEVTIELPFDIHDTYVAVIVGDKNYSAHIKDGKATIILSDLPVGDYTGSVIFLGNDKYFNDTAEFEFSVIDKNMTPISVAVENLTVGDVAYINVTVPAGVGGNVTITVAGNTYTNTTNNGVAKFIIPDLHAGNYEVVATYTEDSKYYGNSTSAKFDVNKVSDYDLPIEIINTSAGGNTTIIVTVPQNATGKVNITVDGVTQEVPIVDGKAVVNVTDLAPGNHTVTVTYGDDKFDTVTNTTTFEIKKVDPEMSASATSVMVGNDVEVTIELPEDITDTYVTVLIGDNSYSVEIKDGEGSLTIPNLPIGNYTGTAIYMGNDKYLNKSVEFKFTVSENIKVLVDGNDGNVTETTVEVPNNGTGNVTIIVDGKEFNGTVVNGTGGVNLTEVIPGEHNVTVIFRDANGTVIENNVTIVVPKWESSINVTAIDIKEGEVAKIDVTLNPGATGVVLIDVDGNGHYITIDDVSGTLEISGLKAGEYSVTATYQGNDYYNGCSNTTKFTVSENIKVNVTGTDGNVTETTVEVPNNGTGNVTVIVDGKEFNGTVVNGTGGVNLTEVIPGEHNVTVIFRDANGTVIENNVTIVVPKWESSINVTAIDIKEGEVAKIDVTLNPGATGVVLIDVGDTGYYITIDDVNGTLEISGLKAGEYSVTAVYEGNDFYNGCNDTTKFTVSIKENATLNIIVGEVNEGADFNVTVEVPEDATGNVTIKINGTEYTSPIIDGKANFTVPGLDAGSYSIDAYYPGDEKYAQNTNSSTVNVVPTKARLIASDLTMYYKNGSSYVVRLVDSTGKGITYQTILMTISGKTYTLKTDKDGYAKLPINLAPNVYDITIKYPGNSKFGPISASHKVTVLSTIIAENIKRGWNSPYDYTATFLDGKGNKLANSPVTFEVNGKTYTVNTDSNGVAQLTTSKLPIGKYSVKITNKANGETVTRTTEIVKRIVENKDVVMDFEDGTKFRVRAVANNGGFVGAGQIVKISVGGKTYDIATDKDGYASLPIHLPAGTYTVVSQYKGYSVTNKLVVKNVVYANDMSVPYHKDFKYSVTLKNSDGKLLTNKEVKVKFYDIWYTAKTNSKGVATFTIKNLSGGGSPKIYVYYEAQLVTKTIKIIK